MKQQIKISRATQYKDITLYYFRTYKQVVLTFIFLLIVADIFVLKENSDLIFFSILATYIVATFFYKLLSAFTFLLSLFVLVMMSILFITSGTSVSTEKAAVWLFFLIGTGIIQQLRE